MKEMKNSESGKLENHGTHNPPVYSRKKGRIGKSGTDGTRRNQAWNG